MTDDSKESSESSSSSGSDSGSKELKFFLNTPSKSAGCSVERRRTRRERFFRSVLRRKPCFIYLLVQIALCAVLVTGGFFLPFASESYVNRKEHLRRQEELYEERKERLTLSHCQYEASDEFHMENCATHCGKDAVFYRVFRLTEESRNDVSCFDKIEAFPCHEKNFCADTSEFLMNNAAADFICLGKGHLTLLEDLMSPDTTIFFPRLDVLSTLNVTHGRLVLTNQMVGKCPRCQVATHWHK
ncbi:hypothetical protein L596_019311 [Steinernema carpocapsae]|uniref:Uncharacterized protein n=1 Tax=Steinernema carpocapsae TaxID=34508 RepID=A0A4U5MQ36_STECR|nr:hypothetical protein L596_019311 [Steinernema carpocapsae]